MTRVAILGAGPAGLAAAKYLSNNGFKADVFERASRVGGLQHSVEYDGLHYDVGAFVFHPEHGLIEAFPFLLDQLVEINYSPRTVTRKGSIDKYPFTFRQFVKDEGLFTSALSIADLLVSKLRYRNPQTVPDFGRYYMGKTLYEKSGLKNYIHRLHGVPDSELDIEFALLRMRPISAMGIREQISRKLEKFNRGKKRKKRLAWSARMVRPESGFPGFYKTIVDDLEGAGVSIHLNSAVTSISSVQDGFEVTVNGETLAYDKVVSTLPIPVALRLCGLPCNNVTEARDLRTLFYRAKVAVPGPFLFNFTDESDWKRISIFSRLYSMPDDGRDFISVEITGDEDSDESLARSREDFESHSRQLGLFSDEVEYVGSYYSPNAYPVYRKGMTEKIEEDKARLADFGLESIGRHGNFEYVISHWVAKAAKEMSVRLTETVSR